MGIRTINKGDKTLTITNLTTYKIALLNGSVPRSSTVDLPLVDYVDRVDAATGLSNLVAAGSISVALDGVSLSATDLKTLNTLEVPVVGFQIMDDTTRPAATAVPAGFTFFNSGDSALNLSDGTDWYDLSTALTT